jgi:hypothetical protein
VAMVELLCVGFEHLSQTATHSPTNEGA